MRRFHDQPLPTRLRIRRGDDDLRRETSHRPIGSTSFATKAFTRRADSIAANIQRSADELPGLISDSHALVRGANDITDQVGRHWLLGGDRSGIEGTPRLSHSSQSSAGRPATLTLPAVDKTNVASS